MGGNLCSSSSKCSSRCTRPLSHLSTRITQYLLSSPRLPRPSPRSSRLLWRLPPPARPNRSQPGPSRHPRRSSLFLEVEDSSGRSLCSCSLVQLRRSSGTTTRKCMANATRAELQDGGKPSERRSCRPTTSRISSDLMEIWREDTQAALLVNILLITKCL